MDRVTFRVMIERLGEAWSQGDAAAATTFFAEEVDYADPMRYRFSTRQELLPFFEPPGDGHRVQWHRSLFDEAAQTGVVEYTYVGQHRYHGAAIVELDGDGSICRWREWQHLDDERDWGAYLNGPDR